MPPSEAGESEEARLPQGDEKNGRLYA